MNLDRVTWTALVIAATLAIATWFGIRRLHAEASSLEHEVVVLTDRIAASSVPEARLESVRGEQSRRRAMLLAEDFDRLPVGAPDLAEVIRRLSLPIDGERVLDQTFTAGRPGAAAHEAPSAWRATPVRVELVGDWSAVSSLLSLVDDLPGPVRTTTLRLHRQDGVDRPIARLELELDVLHRETLAVIGASP